MLKFQGVAVLVELGFIANDSDRAKLLDAQIREAVVQQDRGRDDRAHGRQRMIPAG